MTAQTQATVTAAGAIRRAVPADAPVLSEVAFRSKGHWGYDAAFLESCRADLTVTPQEIDMSPVFVHEGDAGITGFYSLKALDADVVELDSLFLDPAAIGQGIGRLLWNHAIDTATSHGYTDMLIHSDPHAEGFYLAMGAERIGESASTVQPGRVLPLLRVGLSTA